MPLPPRPALLACLINTLTAALPQVRRPGGPAASADGAGRPAASSRGKRRG